VAQAISVGKRVADLEIFRVNEGNKPWAVYSSGLTSFGRTFEGLPDGNIVDQITPESNAYILEVMGDGQICRELDGAIGAMALTATDSRGETRKKFDEQYGLELVAGNIALPSTWNQASNYIRAHNLSGFDLVVSRPVGGLDLENSLNSPKIFQLLMQRMWERLRPDGGILLFQYSLKNSFDPAKYVATLKKHKFTVFDNGRALEIKKDSQSGNSLPFYNESEVVGSTIENELDEQLSVTADENRHGASKVKADFSSAF